MKLQKILAYKYQAKDGERVHYKFNLVVPNEALEKLGWDETHELDWVVDDSRLILKPSGRSEERIRRVKPVKRAKPISPIAPAMTRPKSPTPVGRPISE